MNISEVLKTAIDSRTEIDIVYQGGSHPGAVRTVMPLGIKDGLLKARDIASGQCKSYKMELIALPEKTGAAREDIPFRSYHTLYDLLLLEQKLILDTDLFVVADRFHIRLFKTQADSISSAPLFSIGYEKVPEDSLKEVPGDHQKNNDKNRKPWICNGLPYSELQEAAEAFITGLLRYVKEQKT